MRLLALSLTLTLPSVAAAGTLVSGTLSPVVGGSHRCWATNASERNRSFRIEMLHRDGVVLASRTCNVAGWESCLLDSTTPGRAYCRITMNGSTRSLVGSLEARDATGHLLAALPIP